MLPGARMLFAGSARKPVVQPDYIETDGACVFDSGVVATTPIRAVIDAYVPYVNAGTVCGAYRQSEINVILLRGWTSSVSRVAFAMFNGNTITVRDTSAVAPYYPYRVVAEFEEDTRLQTLSAFGASTSASVSSDIKNLQTHIALLGVGRYGGGLEASAKSGVRIYSFRCWIADELKCDISPSLGEDGQTPCFFDRVSGRYIYNAGSGTPTAGYESGGNS